MTKERIIELLKIELMCVSRNHNHACERDCANCDLVQEDNELLEMYRSAIELIGGTT